MSGVYGFLLVGKTWIVNTKKETHVQFWHKTQPTTFSRVVQDFQAMTITYKLHLYTAFNLTTLINTAYSQLQLCLTSILIVRTCPKARVPRRVLLYVQYSTFWLQHIIKMVTSVLVMLNFNLCWYIPWKPSYSAVSITIFNIRCEGNDRIFKGTCEI